MVFDVVEKLCERLNVIAEFGELRNLNQTVNDAAADRVAVDVGLQPVPKRERLLEEQQQAGDDGADRVVGKTQVVEIGGPFGGGDGSRKA